MESPPSPAKDGGCWHHSGATQEGSAQLPSRTTNSNLEIRIVPVSDHTFRLSIFADAGNSVADDGSLVQGDGPPVARLRADDPARSVRTGNVKVQISPHPPTFSIADAAGKNIQQLAVDSETGILTFLTGDSPLLGLGEAGRNLTAEVRPIKW